MIFSISFLLLLRQKQICEFFCAIFFLRVLKSFVATATAVAAVIIVANTFFVCRFETWFEKAAETKGPAKDLHNDGRREEQATADRPEEAHRVEDGAIQALRARDENQGLFEGRSSSGRC